MNHAPGQTLRIATTLAWEFWASNWRGMLLAPLGAILLPGLVFAGLRSSNGIESLRGSESGALLQFGLYWPTVLLLGSAILSAWGNPRLRYTLPAGSFILVAVPMACAMLTIFVQYSTVAMISNALFDAGWSIWGPGLLAAVLVAWCQAVLWPTWNSMGLRCMAWLASGVALLFAIGQMVKPLPKMAGFLDDFSGWHVLSFGLATLACVGVGAGGFSIVRHGSGIDAQRIVDWFREHVSFGKTARATPFASPQSAQFWLERTERGYILPVGTAFFGIVALLVAFCAPAHNVVGLLAGASFLFLFFVAAIGIVLGIRSPSFEFGSFNGSHPLSDGQLARAILKNATLASISSAAICAAFAVLIALIMHERLETSRLYAAVQQAVVQQIGAFGLLAGIALGTATAWSVVSLVTSLTLAGGRVLGVAVVLACSVPLAGFLVPLCFRVDARPGIAQLYCAVCLACCLAGCTVVYIASWRRQLICSRTLWLAAMLVLASGSLAIAAAHFAGLPLDWKHLLPVFGCCGVIPIPLAAAPLAVYVNRHC
jgi:hypothetical protein